MYSQVKRVVLEIDDEESSRWNGDSECPETRFEEVPLQDWVLGIEGDSSSIYFLICHHLYHKRLWIFSILFNFIFENYRLWETEFLIFETISLIPS